MNTERRQVLKLGTALALAVTAGIIKPRTAWAAQQEWNEKAFSATDVESVVDAFGGSDAEESDKIQLTAPDIAENGAVEIGRASCRGREERTGERERLVERE